MCLILLNFEQPAFTQASFLSLSNIYECSGGLQMTPSSLGKQTADCESPHNWLQNTLWVNFKDGEVVNNQIIQLYNFYP